MADDNAEGSAAELPPTPPIPCDLPAPNNYALNLLGPSTALTRAIKNYILMLALTNITDRREAVWYGPWMMVLDILFMDTQIMPNGICYPVPQLPVSFDYDPAESDEDWFSDDDDADRENLTSDPFNVDYERSTKGLTPSSGRKSGAALIKTPPTTPGGSFPLDLLDPNPPSPLTPSPSVPVTLPPSLGEFGHLFYSPSPLTPSPSTPPPPGHNLSRALSEPLESLPSQPHTPSASESPIPFRYSNTGRRHHHRRRRSTRVPDICQIVRMIVCGGDGLECRINRIVLIVEVKALDNEADIGMVVHNTQAQIISQANHAFRADKGLEILGCIIAVAHHWTYFEHTREDVPPSPTASEHDDATYHRATSSETTSSSGSGTSTQSGPILFPADFLRDIFQERTYLSLQDDQGLSNRAFGRIYDRLKARIDALQ